MYSGKLFIVVISLMCLVIDMRWLFLLFVVAVFLVGCADSPPEEGPEPKLCSADVLVCPDGSYVARDPDNNCAFKPCPGQDTS
jgi:hypothetical protein